MKGAPLALAIEKHLLQEIFTDYERVLKLLGGSSNPGRFNITPDHSLWRAYHLCRQTHLQEAALKLLARPSRPSGVDGTL